MGRAARQLKVLEIISKHDIDTQEELVNYLKQEGFDVTQATVSRDIKDMNLIKTLTADGRRYKYVSPQQTEITSSDKYLKLFKNTVLSIDCCGNLIVLKTEAGGTGPAAELIDRLHLNGVMGVLAGENTIFVAINTDIASTQDVCDKLENLLD